MADTLAEARPVEKGNLPAPMLALNNVEVIYDHVILVLKGVSLAVPKGAIVALLGANGAGKSTTLKAISNLLLTERGKVTKGSVEFMGARVDGLSPSELVRRGWHFWNQRTREGLEHAACEDYARSRSDYERVLGNERRRDAARS